MNTNEPIHENTESDSNDNIPALDDNEVENLKDLSEEDILTRTFQSENEAYLFYNQYARVHGFSIRRCTIKKDDNDQIVVRLFTCSCAGLRRKEFIEMKNRQREHKGLTKCDCKAQLWIKLNRIRSCYEVTKFVKEHNHELVPSYGVPMLRSHQRVDDGHRDQAYSLNRVGISSSRTYDLFTQEAGAYDGVGFARKDLYNMMDRDKRVEITIGDANVALGYLHGKADSDPFFYFQYTVDENNRLDKLLWTDGLSREEFEVFGDVLIFDATYKTNSYKFPLIILAGINNHRKTCIFGAALVQNETIESYVWVLNTLLNAMNNKRPVSVVTDGDKSMHAAIEEVLPNARHRLCMWHLEQNCKKNVKIHGFSGVFDYFLKVDCSATEFENAWRNMVVHHGLQNHNWISQTYHTRNMWAEPYLRGHFFGWLKSTQRCEGMNAFLNRYLGSNRRLIDFVRDYHRGLERIRVKVVNEEVKTNHTSAVLTTELQELERHASLIFTRAVFFNVVAQIKMQALLWNVEVSDNGLGGRTYLVADSAREGLLRFVTFNTVTLDIACDCLMFESTGIPCKHLIYVMKCEGLGEIPSTCINKRWSAEVSKDLREKGLKTSSTNEVEIARHEDLTSKSTQMNFYGKKTKQGYKEVNEGVLKLTTRAKELWMMELNENNVEPDLSQSTQFDVEDPQIARPKGRMKSQIKRAPRHCSKCREIGHQANTCKKQRNHRTYDTPNPLDGSNNYSHTNQNFSFGGTANGNVSGSGVGYGNTVGGMGYEFIGSSQIGQIFGSQNNNGSSSSSYHVTNNHFRV